MSSHPKVREEKVKQIVSQFQSLKCFICGEGVTRAEEYQAHLERHLNIETPSLERLDHLMSSRFLCEDVQCDQCSFKSNTKAELDAHKLDEHDSDLVCKFWLCTFNTKSRAEIAVHDSYHKVYMTCPACGAFGEQKDIHHHTMGEHTKWRLKCRKCKACFFTEEDLDQHEQEVCSILHPSMKRY